MSHKETEKTARQWKNEVRRAAREDIDELIAMYGEGAWDTVWARIEGSDDGYIDIANEEEKEGEEAGAGLRYLLERVNDRLGIFYEDADYLSEPRLRLPRQGAAKYRSPKPKTPQEAVPDARFRAMSEIIAALANKEEDIRNFREEVLGGQLLTPEEVPRWIRDTREKEGFTFELTLSITAGEGWEERLVEHAKQVALYSKKEELYPGTRYGLADISYMKPGSRWREVIPINITGTLGRLKRLAKKYKVFWPEGSAVQFILTGQTPLVSPAKTGTDINSYGFNKIRLEVSPHLTGDEVRNLYLGTRNWLFEALKAGRNTRRLKEKHIRLAVFAATTPGGPSWKMKKWNRQYPKWKYQHRSKFERDYRAAYRNVTGWEWEG